VGVGFRLPHVDCFDLINRSIIRLHYLLDLQPDTEKKRNDGKLSQ
jgi:hypothetical protein